MTTLLKHRMSFSRCFLTLFLMACLLPLWVACTARPPVSLPTDAEAEEAESRTEFTERLENFFEHDPLKAGKASQFLIHLTDLSDGAPVEKAEVTLLVRPKGAASEAQRVAARVGKVTGIYVAEVNVPKAGEYDIEFRIKNAKLDERMPLTDFKVE